MYSGLVIGPAHFIKTSYQPLLFAMMFRKNLEVFIPLHRWKKETWGGRCILILFSLLKQTRISRDLRKDYLNLSLNMVLVSNLSFKSFWIIFQARSISKYFLNPSRHCRYFSFKGIVRSFHQKNKKKNFLSGIKLYISVAILWKKWMKWKKWNHQILKILMAPNFYLSKIQWVTLDLSMKCLILLDVINMIFLFFVSTLLGK